MTKRAERKTETRKKIVEAAATRFRKEGLKGASIARILGDAQLTHGTFYAHFKSKEAMLSEAFIQAVAETSERWIKGVAELPTNQGISLLIARNLGRAHLEHPETGCPFVAVGAEVWRGESDIREAYEEGILTVAHKVANSLGDEDDVNQALAIHAICLGGLTMARSVANEEIALQIMRACRHFVLSRLPSKEVAPGRQQEHQDAR